MQILVHTPARVLFDSIHFYQKLGFELLFESPMVVLADSQFMVELNPDPFARPGLKLIKEDWSSELTQLKEITTIYEINSGYLIDDNNGCRVYLIEGEPSRQLSEMASAKCMLGSFSGLSLETFDMQSSLNFWTVLGFETVYGTPEDSYLVTKNESFSVSFMKPLTCPHLFFNPSLTFFNSGKNLEVIEKIREAGIQITEEITVFNEQEIVDNVIIRDPSGYGFFVFND